MDSVLRSVGQGPTGLLDQFKHRGGDSDLLGELLLGESSDLAGGMKWVDFGGNSSRSAGFGILHLTKDACIYYIGNMNDESNLNPTESASQVGRINSI